MKFIRTYIKNGHRSVDEFTTNHDPMFGETLSRSAQSRLCMSLIDKWNRQCPSTWSYELLDDEGNENAPDSTSPDKAQDKVKILQPDSVIAANLLKLRDSLFKQSVIDSGTVIFYKINSCLFKADVNF